MPTGVVENKTYESFSSLYQTTDLLSTKKGIEHFNSGILSMNGRLGVAVIATREGLFVMYCPYRP